MSFDKIKRAEMLDRVRGEGTQAFLDELVKDEFSDWQLSDAKKKSSVTKANENDNRCKSKTLSSVTGKEYKQVQSEPQREKELLSLEKSNRVKFSTPQPQRKWTRFPKREPAIQDKPVEKDKDTMKPIKDHNPPKGDCTDLLGIEEATQFLDNLQLEPDEWRDVSGTKFEVRHKKMESFLQNLLCDGQERRVNTDHEMRRKGSSSSLESTATLGSSSSQEQNTDYLSACTEEQMIAYKMEEIKRKLKTDVLDNWMDDVELALLLMKTKSKTSGLKSSEIKCLLNNIERK